MDSIWLQTARLPEEDGTLIDNPATDGKTQLRCQTDFIRLAFFLSQYISMNGGDVTLDHTQKELVSVLLGHIHSLGLISHSTYSGAVELVHSRNDLPELFQVPVCLAEEAAVHERAQNTP